jgi:hypothetical protein
MSQEQTNQQNQNQAKMPLNRRQRRYMMKQNGMLKYLSKLSFFHPTKAAIRQQNMENGRKMQEARLDAAEKAQAERLEAALERMKETWSNIGYNKEEMAMLEEAWALTAIKDRETYRADVKQSRKLMKEAAASLAARNNK